METDPRTGGDVLPDGGVNVRRVTVTGVETPNGITVVLPDGHGGAFVTDRTGTAYWSTVDEIRSFPDELDRDVLDDEPWLVEYYAALAAILDEWETP